METEILKRDRLQETQERIKKQEQGGEQKETLKENIKSDRVKGRKGEIKIQGKEAG